LHNKEIDKVWEFINMERTKSYLDAEMQVETHVSGRHFDGIEWFIEEEIKPRIITFINHEISVLKIQEWYIIDVYIHANINNSKSSYDEHLHDIQQLKSKIRETSYDTKLLILGDFNSDFKNPKTL
jgi:exonuclease III